MEAASGVHLVSAMTPQELRDRTDRFADSIIAFCRGLPKDALSQRIAGQLQDAGTSTAANYHAACRARTRSAFVAKLSIVVEEADESLYWLRRLQNSSIADVEGVEPLLREASELVAIFVASQRTATRR
jgi:four helix bundle protein